MYDDESLIESSRLLPLTSDDSDDTMGKIPDLNLHKANTSPANNIPGRTRRKIRLKRRDRDYRLNNSLGGHSFLSEGSADRDSDCFCQPISRSHYITGNRNSRRFLQQPSCMAMLLLFVVSVIAALFSLSYFALTLQEQLSAITLRLETVMEEKKVSVEQNHQAQDQLDSLFSNQTSMLQNLAALFQNVNFLTTELESVNSSMFSISKSLESAPVLESLPSTVFQVQADLSALGSKVSDLEIQINTVQNNLVQGLIIVNQTIKAQQASNSAHRPREAEQVESLVESLSNRTSQIEVRVDALQSSFNQFSAQINQQLKQQDAKAIKTWDLLSELQDSTQNATSKAMSSEVVCNSSLERLKVLETKFYDVIASRKGIQISNQSQATTNQP